MTTPNDDLAARILHTANQAAGASLTLPPDGDVPLEAFGFDSLSLFVFLLELERVCGMKFDETLLGNEASLSIRSIAALVESRATPALAGK